MTAAPLQVPAGMFSGIGTAKALLDANYVKPGQYYFLIRNCKLAQTRKLEWFIANEFTVIHVLDDDGGKGHKLGEECSHLVLRSNDYFLSEVKSFIAGAMGITPDDVNEQYAMEVYGAGQPLKGYVVEVHARNVVTKPKPGAPNGTDFTRITYKREVPASELLESLLPEVKARYFPNGVLENLAAAENAPAK